MLLKEKHDVLDLLLALPGLRDHLNALLSDSVNLYQDLNVVLDHGKGIDAIFLHYFFCELGAHALDQAGTKIFFHAINSRWKRLLPFLAFGNCSNNWCTASKNCKKIGLA